MASPFFEHQKFGMNLFVLLSFPRKLAYFPHPQCEIIKKVLHFLDNVKKNKHYIFMDSSAGSHCDGLPKAVLHSNKGVYYEHNRRHKTKRNGM
jgi:hypothetical protein